MREQIFDSDNRFKKDFIKLTKKIRETGEISLENCDFDYLPTLRCNLNCPWCYQQHTREKNLPSIKNEMNFEQFKNVFDKLDINGKIVKFIGGEPFVKKEIFDMMKYFKQKGAYNIIGTNGLLPFVNHPKEVVEKLRNYNIIEVTSSIDGLGDVHDKVRRRKGLFQRMSRFVQESTKYFKVLTETVIQEKNIGELDKILKTVKKWGVYKHRFQMPMFATSEEIEQIRRKFKDNEIDAELRLMGKRKYAFSLDELLNGLDSIKKTKISHATHPIFLHEDPKTSYNMNIREKYDLYCTYLFRIRIEPDGLVRPCPFIIRPFGDLKKQSLEEIWNSEEYKNYRKNLLENNLIPVCENCAHLRKYDGKMRYRDERR